VELKRVSVVNIVRSRASRLVRPLCIYAVAQIPKQATDILSKATAADEDRRVQERVLAQDRESHGPMRAPSSACKAGRSGESGSFGTIANSRSRSLTLFALNTSMTLAWETGSMSGSSSNPAS
jgi:hypothetical protein